MHKGQKASPESIQRMRKAAQQRNRDPEYRRKLSEANQARALNPTPAMLAGRKKMQATLIGLHQSSVLQSPMKGRSPSAATREKLRLSMCAQFASRQRISPWKNPTIHRRAMQTRTERGHHPTAFPEVRARIAVTLRRRYTAGELTPPMHQPGAREKMSLRWKGIPKSADQRRKVSDGMKRAHAEGRAALGWKYVGHPSKGERRIARQLRRHGFIGQFPFAIGCSIRYKIDFAHASKILAVEIDGATSGCVLGVGQFSGFRSRSLILNQRMRSD
jgi:hypothetical protein